MRPVLITKHSEEPVDLGYFIDHASIAVGQDDADAQAKLIAATRMIEHESGRLRLLQSTWDFRLECFPCRDYIDLPLPQVSSISYIKFTDSAAVLNTMPSADYHLVGGYAPGDPDPTDADDQVTYGARVYLRYGRSWPSASLETGEPVVVRFVAGWRASQNVPEDLKAAICLQGAHLYRNREAVTVGNTAVESRVLARGVPDLIAGYRWKFYG